MKKEFFLPSLKQKAQLIQFQFLEKKRGCFYLAKTNETDSSTLGLWTAKQLPAIASQPSLLVESLSLARHNGRRLR